MAEGMTYQEIGAVEGISAERARQIIERGLDKLRTHRRRDVAELFGMLLELEVGRDRIAARNGRVLARGRTRTS